MTSFLDPVSRRAFITSALTAPLLVSAVSAPVRVARAAATDEVAGTVVRLQGNAVAMQDALPRPLKVGDKILRGDVISTGKNARLEFRMLDDAVMTLGERAVFVVIDYITGGSEPNAAMRLMQGAFLAVSGDLVKTAQARFVIETETATVGIRGTTVWGGPLDGEFQVVMLDGRGVYVENRGGRVDLAEAGGGTKIPTVDRAPTSPVMWSDQKIARAAASVAFR